MADLTVIYYTNNREDSAFEARIQRSLRHNAERLPIVSVSQKPISFGENICVGDVGVCGHNALRQMLIGATAAKTRFVCTCEADFLHPKEFFQYRPETDDTFCMSVPLYVLFARLGDTPAFYRKPQGSEGSMVVGREFLIDKMTEMFTGKETWVKQDARHSLKYLYTHGKSLEFCTSVPTITFKTEGAMHRKTPVIQSSRVKELPGWGTANRLVRKYL